MDFALRRQWAANIKQGRKARRMSQQRLGELCDVDQSTVSRWERYESIPSEDSKVAIAQAFDVEDPRIIFPLRLNAQAPEPVGAST